MENAITLNDLLSNVKQNQKYKNLHKLNIKSPFLLNYIIVEQKK